MTCPLLYRPLPPPLFPAGSSTPEGEAGPVAELVPRRRQRSETTAAEACDELGSAFSLENGDRKKGQTDDLCEGI